MLFWWILPQMEENSSDVICQRGGTRPRLHIAPRTHLNAYLHSRWVGGAGVVDAVFAAEIALRRLVGLRT